MLRGLQNKKSSLKMLPAYIDRPLSSEKGRSFAIDLGGTNLRILEAGLKGKGRIVAFRQRQFSIKRELLSGGAEAFFDFIALSLKSFLEEKSKLAKNMKLGFTFSFPMLQTGIASGRLIHWTKEFSVRSVTGKDVVNLFNAALIRKGLKGIKIVALLNDTVATLIARSYKDKNCDIALILGTGTNACYYDRTRQGIINIEWGSFNKLPRTVYDLELDKSTDNPGEQTLEKMVSGRYLGRIARLTLKGLGLNIPGLETEYLSGIELDSSKNLLRVKARLKSLGLAKSSLEERKLVKDVCLLVSLRAARIVAASLAAVIMHIDKNLSRRHSIAIDGSLYQRHPWFSRNIKLTLKEIFGKKAAKIKLVLTKNGSSQGAAIAAAVASKCKI